MAWPVHEFIIIFEGKVVMVEEDRETVIGPGESFFTQKGRRCVWNQAGYAKKFMVIFEYPSTPGKDSRRRPLQSFTRPGRPAVFP
ncbi:MAG: hypothetical protein HY245_09955 [Rhizobiales bacterium]|nr:hypothetical protein [Hyphomicrobiales bacterium]MBI3673724.1 hypothetical protein [Hyphomicrobiales bacterium]